MKRLVICKKLLRAGKKHLRLLATRVRALVTKGSMSVAEMWRRHLDRVAEEPSYAQTFITVVIAVRRAGQRQSHDPIGDPRDRRRLHGCGASASPPADPRLRLGVVRRQLNTAQLIEPRTVVRGSRRF
jgi:hypothetical protein